MFKCGKQLYRSYLLSGLLSKKALSSPSHLLHLLSCFCPLHVARASGQHPRPLGPHSASSRLAAKISSRKHLPSLWHVFLRENLDQTIPYTFTFTFIWEPKRLYHNTLSIYTISMFSLLASSNAVKYRPTLTSNIPQLSPTVRSISSLPGLDVPPLPGSSRSSPPPGLSPAAPSRSWTAPPWRGSQRRRTDPRWRPGCAPRVRRRVPGARSVSWSSGGFPRAAKTGKDPLFEDFWRAGGYLANWTVNWMGHLKKFVHKRCNACWCWWLQEVPTPKAPGSKGGCLFLALFWPPGSWQTTKLGMLSNCQQQKKTSKVYKCQQVSGCCCCSWSLQVVPERFFVPPLLQPPSTCQTHRMLQQHRAPVSALAGWRTWRSKCLAQTLMFHDHRGPPNVRLQ